MGKVVTISAKIPEEVYKELVLRVPEGDRSSFIREAIIEKLQKIPRPDRIFEMEKRIANIEDEISQIKKYLAELELVTTEKGKVNPYTFCLDTLDQKIIDYLIHYKGATTPELAEHTKTNRWLVLNRLRRINKLSKKQIGKPIVEYYAGEKSGKRKAWWINQELIET